MGHMTNDEGEAMTPEQLDKIRTIYAGSPPSNFPTMLIAEVDRLNAALNEAKADAWDEGYDEGLGYMTVTAPNEEEPDNPYRKESPDA